MAIKVKARHFSQVNKRDNVYLISNDIGFPMQKWLSLSFFFIEISTKNRKSLDLAKHVLYTF